MQHEQSGLKTKKNCFNMYKAIRAWGIKKYRYLCVIIYLVVHPRRIQVFSQFHPTS